MFLSYYHMNLNISELEEKMIVGIQPKPKAYQQSALRKQLITTHAKSEKKKVSYDDILSSLKMKVTDGKLQFMRTDDAAIESINMPKEEPIHNKGNRKIVSFNEQPPNFYVSPPPQIKMAPKTLKTRHLPIPQEYQEDVIQRPLTRQEAIIKLLQAREEAARIRQIKSTKLQFSTQNIKVHPTIAPQMSNMFFKFMS